MRNLVIFGARPGATPAASALSTVTVDGVTVRCGIVTTPDRARGRGANCAEQADRADDVLVRVRAFSCNYRDRVFFYAMQGVPEHRFTAIGSEFVATVVDVAGASGVNDLAPGDRVIPTHHYTARASGDGAREGVITNQASRELQLVARAKLMRVPANMPDDVAAVFGLNAQTAYSMIRRLRLRDGARVLVTSAGASVSLAVVAALRAKSITTFAATTSPHVAQTLDALGVAGTLVVDRDGPPFRATTAVNEFAAACGGFDAVIDPFFDLHVEKAVEILAPFGQYITCGLAGQNPNSRRAAGVEAPIDGTRLLTLVGLKNISIIGNCLGLTDDLAAALDDYAAGRLRTFVDSVFTGDDVAPFLSRTFGGARIGKVAYRFAD